MKDNPTRRARRTPALHRHFAQALFALGGVLLFLFGRRRQRNLQRLFDGVHVMDVQVLKLFRRQVFEHVGLVLGGQNHVVDSSAFGRQDFLLDPAEGPSLGIAPAGTWIWMSWSWKKSSEMPSCKALERTQVRAACMDSCITCPSCPVMVNPPLPFILLA